MFRIFRTAVTRGISLQITVLNDREFWIARQKSNSIQELETPGLHRESKSDLLTEMFDFFLIRMSTKEKEFFRNLVLGLVPTPAKHVLLVHTKISQGLNIHPGSKIRYIFTHKQMRNRSVLVERR